jgi:4-aminobutyrate aminotransferase-like enzyme
LPKLVGPVPGPKGEGWVDLLAAHECPAITARRDRRAVRSGVGQDPIVWERALGANVWDPDGNRFVDLTGGFGVASAGHANPFVVQRVHEQLGQLVHGLGDAFPSRVRIALAARLAGITPGELNQSIFASSGSEAVEAAIKTAVMATGRSKLITFTGGYHGMSLGVLPASHYRPSFSAPFEGLLRPFAEHRPWGAPLTLDSADLPAAILLEPIQGRGGDRCPPAGWIRSLRALCDAHDVLLIFDEIFTGFGRCGSLFLSGTDACDGVVPDLLCLGKGLTSGFPLSVCIGTDEVMGAWGLSGGEALHTSTFLGHPVGCAAALAVTDLFAEHDLLEAGQRLGRAMGDGLEALRSRHPGRIGEIRGRGAMRGVEILPSDDAFSSCRALLERGYLVLPSGGNGEVISMTPSLTMTQAQWDGALRALEAVL